MNTTLSQMGLVPALLDPPVTMASDSFKGLDLNIKMIRPRRNGAVEEEGELRIISRTWSKEEVTLC